MKSQYSPLSKNKKTRSQSPSVRLQSKSLSSKIAVTPTRKTLAAKSLVTNERSQRAFDESKIRWPEMVQYSFDGMHELRIFRWNVQAGEIAALQSDDVIIRFEKAGAMHYLIMEIDSAIKSKNVVFRAPISWWLLPSDERALPEIGTPLRITLINGKSGVIEVERELSLASATEKALIACLQTQAGETFGHLEMDAQFKSDLRA